MYPPKPATRASSPPPPPPDQSECPPAARSSRPAPPSNPAPAVPAPTSPPAGARSPASQTPLFEKGDIVRPKLIQLRPVHRPLRSPGRPALPLDIQRLKLCRNFLLRFQFKFQRHSFAASRRQRTLHPAFAETAPRHACASEQWNRRERPRYESRTRRKRFCRKSLTAISFNLPARRVGGN